MDPGPSFVDIPFVSEDSDEAEEHTLPPRPASICRACWQGPFALHLGLPCQVPGHEGQFYRQWKKSHSYLISFPELKSRALAGCAWCQLLVTVLKEMRTRNPTREPEDSLHITVRGFLRHNPDRTPQNYQAVDVTINSDQPIFSGVVHTTPGMLAYRSFQIADADEDFRRQCRTLYRRAEPSPRSRLASCHGSR